MTNFSSPHLSFFKLIDLAEARLAHDEAAVAAQHLAQCVECATQRNEIAQLIKLMWSDATEAVPPALTAQAEGLLRAHLPLRSPVEDFSPSPFDKVSDGLRRIVAALSFDSATLAPAFGVRSASAAAEARQLLFSAEGTDLDLRVSRANGDDWRVSGQLLSADSAAGGNVELLGEAISVQATLNELCEFALPPVPQGTYMLLLRTGETIIEVSLDMGS